MPRKLRGKRCRRLFYEEAGSDPILKKKWDQGEALVTVTGRKVGTRLAWGTGGDMDALAGLGQIFTNPLANNVLPYKHNYTTDNSFIFTGMFIPAFNVVTVPGYIDKRGYTDPELGKSFYNKTREAKKSNAVDYMTYIAEYCFTPDEALSKIVENQFDRDLLIEQKARIELLKTVKLPKRGTVLSTTNDTKDLEFLESPNGKVLMLEKPIKYDYAGNPYKNLYIAGIDSIDQGLDDSTGQKDVSDYCLVIKKRTLGVEGNQYVCIYKDRPKDIRRAYDMTIALLEYYGCQALLENSRTAIITYFKEKKKLNLLMKRPHASMSNVEARTNTMHGVPPTTKTIEHYLELISDYIFDYSYNINFIEMVNELLNYSYERKRKFDIVAAMGMCELADEELSGLGRNTKVKQKDANMRDVGYYTDAYGRKRFGVIPKKEEIIPNDLREFIE